MATVKMKRGSHYADIFDSPETIKQAESEGYELVKGQETIEKEVSSETEEEDGETPEIERKNNKRKSKDK